MLVAVRHSVVASDVVDVPTSQLLAPAVEFSDVSVFVLAGLVGATALLSLALWARRRCASRRATRQVKSSALTAGLPADATDDVNTVELRSVGVVDRDAAAADAATYGTVAVTTPLMSTTSSSVGYGTQVSDGRGSRSATRRSSTTRPGAQRDRRSGNPGGADAELYQPIAPFTDDDDDGGAPVYTADSNASLVLVSVPLAIIRVFCVVELLWLCSHYSRYVFEHDVGGTPKREECTFLLDVPAGAC